MPGKHKNPTIAFRPSSSWEYELITQRAELSGMDKKVFYTKSCIYSNIVVVGDKRNIKKIIDAVFDMKQTLEIIAGQIQSGDFSISDAAFVEMREEYLATVITIVDILNGASYLFEKNGDNDCNRHWKEELELGQLREVLQPKND